MPTPGFYIGVMSGTSLDGADAILCDFNLSPPGTLAFASLPYPDDLRHELLALNIAGDNELARAAMVSNHLSRLYSQVTAEVLTTANLSAADVMAIGCHGQTVRHSPSVRYTIQLQNPALLAELTGINVVADFRSRDIAAGGQGAPLVPAFHAGIFASADIARAVVNVGGISNITAIIPGQKIIGFDCGPGNVLMDAWIYANRGERFDNDGVWAGSGKVLPALLEKLLADTYFKLPPPKSTGRELFSLKWLNGNIHAVFEPVDIQATLLEFTSTVIANDVKKFVPQCGDVIVCGGGAYNKTLMTRLAMLLPAMHLLPSDNFGVPAQHVEAMAFAWFAKQAIERKPIDLTLITGANHPNILGAIYPA